MHTLNVHHDAALVSYPALRVFDLLIIWNICLGVAFLTAGTFIVYSYKYLHDDGRVSYPLCFIFSSPVGKKLPLWLTLNWHYTRFLFSLSGILLTSTWLCSPGCQPGLQMMYAGSKNKLVQSINMTKVSGPSLLPFSIYAEAAALSLNVQKVVVNQYDFYSSWSQYWRERVVHFFNQTRVTAGIRQFCQNAKSQPY